jgi:hypothetical protein
MTDDELARRRLLVPLAAAAVVVLLFSGTMALVALRARSPDESLRGNVDAVELIEPRGATGSRPVRFMWHSLREPARYTLEVFTPEGDVAYTIETGDTAVTLPPETVLNPGETYHWWIMARTPTGGESRTAPEAFRP